MKPTHIEHLGIAVNKLDEVIPYYEQLLGTKCYSIEEVVDQKYVQHSSNAVKLKSSSSNQLQKKALSLNGWKKILKVAFTT